MPYIEEASRQDLDPFINKVINELEGGDWKPGEVNYTIYRIMLAWWKNESRYSTVCSIMGTLACVAQEFYRKIAGPYENKAAERNGDVT